MSGDTSMFVDVARLIIRWFGAENSIFDGSFMILSNFCLIKLFGMVFLLFCELISFTIESTSGKRRFAARFLNLIKI